MTQAEPKPSEYYCRKCGRDLIPHPSQAWGVFYIHTHNNSVACQWPAPKWSLYGENADPVRRATS